MSKRKKCTKKRECTREQILYQGKLCEYEKEEKTKCHSDKENTHYNTITMYVIQKYANKMENMSKKLTEESDSETQ